MAVVVVVVAVVAVVVVVVIFSYVLKVLELRRHYLSVRLSVCPSVRVLVASINSDSVRALGYSRNSPL